MMTGLAWVSLVPLGFFYLEREGNTAVPSTHVAAMFPKDSTVALSPTKPTLVLFFHPYCPCSRASLGELDHILAETQGNLSAIVVFTIATGEPAGWEQASLWKSAEAMPGVAIRRDLGGKLARDFGVTGSGHALLYSPSGRLLFSGGITASRGHDGDNAGESAIVSFVLHGNAVVDHTPVFGCALL